MAGLKFEDVLIPAACNEIVDLIVTVIMLNITHFYRVRKSSYENNCSLPKCFR